MKVLFTSLFLIYSFCSFSQEKETKFSTQPKDSILMRHVPDTVLKNEKCQDSIKPPLFEPINKLDEVFIQSKSKFNAVSLGIIQKEIKPLTQYERQLYTAGDFKPIHLLSLLGGSLQVDLIINAISGRTKRLKKYIEFEKKENNLIFLEDHFTKYMLNNLNIEEEILGRFLNYLVENENLQDLIDRKNNGELYFFIGDEWFKFRSLQHETPLITRDPNYNEK